MIPKIIHYCWFGGGDKPKSVLDCIATWRAVCPDYSIKEWNEGNFDVRLNRYISEAYDERKYAFVSDYARLYALNKEGGIYLDTDVELLKSFSGFLHHTSFLGFESPIHVQTGVMASEMGILWVSELLNEYNSRVFIQPNGKLDMTTNVKKTTDYFIEHGLVPNGSKQNIVNCDIYSLDYFCAKDHRTGIISKTENTVCIHHYEGSWGDSNGMGKFKHSFKLRFAKIFGGRVTSFIADIITFRKFN